MVGRRVTLAIIDFEGFSETSSFDSFINFLRFVDIFLKEDSI